MDGTICMMIYGVQSGLSVCIELSDNRELLDFEHILMDGCASEAAIFQSTDAHSY